LHWFLETVRRLLALTPAIMVTIIAHEYPRYFLYRRFDPDRNRDVKLPPPGFFRRIDPIGLMMFYLFKFGWSRRYPVNYWKLKRKGTSRAVFTALSGSAGNLLVGVIAGVVFYVSGVSLYAAEIASGTAGSPLVSYLADVMYWIMIVNLNTALFNILPIPPLDGATVVTIIAPPQYVNWLVKYELYGIIALLALSALGIIQMIMYPVTEFVALLARVIS